MTASLVLEMRIRGGGEGAKGPVKTSHKNDDDNFKIIGHQEEPIQMVFKTFIHYC